MGRKRSNFELSVHFKIYFVSIFLLLVSCTQTPNGTAHPEKDPVLKSYYDSLRKKLMGKWGGGEGSPGMDIGVDSIFFYHLSSAHPYRLNRDTLIVKFLDRDTVVVFGKITIQKDTLSWYNSDEGFSTYAYRYIE